MTLGEKLLNLTIEYRKAVELPAYGDYAPATRKPEEIAAEYEAELRAGLGLEDRDAADTERAVTP